MIAYESGVADVVDPLGGSYYVERLTNGIENAVNVYLNKIDSIGGAIAAIKSGYVQKEIQDSSYRYQQSIESGEKEIADLRSKDIIM
jgi:methylmalonyl-CoA mutase N-terminal domain/subunit